MPGMLDGRAVNHDGNARKRAIAAYYAESGRVSPHAILGLLLAGSMAGVAVGAIYACAIWYIPFVYLNLLAPVLFGSALGSTLGWLIQKFHVRNTAVAVSLASLISLTSLYVSWMSWIWFATGRWFNGPSQIWEVIRLINAQGLWEVFHVRPTGTLLWAVWAAEALIVTAIPIVSSWRAVRVPYCEGCRKWIEGKKEFGPFQAVDVNSLRSHLEAGDLAVLGALEPGSNTDGYFILRLQKCARCQIVNLLTLRKITPRTMGLAGQLRPDTKPPINKLMVSGEWGREIESQLAESVY